MKKRILILFAGLALFSSLLLLSCGGAAPQPPCEVTFYSSGAQGAYGNFGDHRVSKTVYVNKGDKVNIEIPQIKSEYSDFIIFDKYKNKSGEPVSFPMEINEENTFYAYYKVKPVQNVSIENITPEELTVKFKSPSLKINKYKMELKEGSKLLKSYPFFKIDCDSDFDKVLKYNADITDVDIKEVSNVYVVVYALYGSMNSDPEQSEAFAVGDYAILTFNSESDDIADFSRKTVRVRKGNQITSADSIQDLLNLSWKKDIYKEAYEVSYCIEDTPVTFPYAVNDDVVIVAKYKIRQPKEVKCSSFSESHLRVDIKTCSKKILDLKVEILKDSEIIKTFEKAKDADFFFKKSDSVDEIFFYSNDLGLSFNTDYKIKVYTLFEGKESEPVIKEVKTKNYEFPSKKYKVLMMMYMDGDNNLNDPIFLDLNEVEAGLCAVNSDDIKVIALWDGWKEDSKPQFVHPQTRLLDVGKDSTNVVYVGNSQITFEGYNLSDETVDISSKASWLSGGEVDMSKKETLENFLTFVKEHYDAENYILQFSNHGGGTRNAPDNIFYTPDGKMIEHQNYGRRSMCWDDSSAPGTENFLHTVDVSAVLEKCGFKDDKKIDVVIEDVCLGGSIEEAYQLKNYANYLIASPNNIPGKGLDYIKLIDAVDKKYCKSKSYKEFAEAVIKQYQADYKLSYLTWKAYFEELNINTSNQNATGFAVISNTKASTLSCIELKKLDSVVEKINQLADEVIKNGNKKSKKFFIKDGKISVKNEPGSTPVERKELIKAVSLTPGAPIYYMGAFVNLFDLGYMTNFIGALFGTDEWNGTDGDGNISAMISDVKSALKDAIVYSWRDGYRNPAYCTDSSYVWLSGDFYGLSVSGAPVKLISAGGKSYVENDSYQTWYDDLEFAKQSKWDDLLKILFP